MPPRLEQIQDTLKQMCEKTKDVQAAMVAKSGLEGVIIFPDTFKEDISDIWEPVSKSVDEILDMVAAYSDYGLDRAYIEVLGYGIGFLVIPGSDTALIVFISKKSGREPLEVFYKSMEEMTQARDRIIEIEES